MDEIFKIQLPFRRTDPIQTGKGRELKKKRAQRNLCFYIPWG